MRRALALALLALAACRPAPARPARTLALQPCRVKDLSAPALCGTYEVLENREARSGRRIPLRVVVVPSLAPEPQPDPLFLLAGGPGQGIVEAFGPMLPGFERVRRNRDLVLVDMRGTGRSGPLPCVMSPPDAPLAERLSSSGFTAERLRACLASYEADPTQYTTAHAVADLEEVRAALGYDQVDLWGGSYGTRLGLAYMRAHSGRVRTAVLDGVAPYDNRLPLYFARDGQRALRLLLETCALDHACAQAWPDLKARFEELLQQLATRPAAVTVSDPVSGEPARVTIDRDTFAASLRGVLYVPELASLVPLIIDRARQGDFGPFVAATVGLDQGFSRNMNLGLFFSVVCTEDVPFIRPEEVEPLSERTFFGPRLTRELIDACAVWPHGTMPADLRAPVRADTPTLLLSGELDPATPPAWGALAARTLPNSVHLVVPGVGHGASLQGCVPELIARVIEEGAVKGLDASCIRSLARPPFFVTRMGPTP